MIFGIADDGYSYYPLNQSIRFPIVAVDKDQRVLTGAKAQVKVIKHEYRTVLSKAGSYFRYESQQDDKLIKKEVSADEFTKAGDFLDQLASRHTLYFGHERPSDFHFEIEFNTKQQPAFNRQFDLLISDLKNWEKNGFQLNLFAENPKQLERLYTIFKDLNAEI